MTYLCPSECEVLAPYKEAIPHVCGLPNLSGYRGKIGPGITMWGGQMPRSGPEPYIESQPQAHDAADLPVSSAFQRK